MTMAVKIAQQSPSEYRAWGPALPGCTARGQSTAEVQSRMREAMVGYLASLDAPLPRDWDGQFSSEMVSSQS
jgi:predicted RNase H-like HicB family nuclease